MSWFAPRRVKLQLLHGGTDIPRSTKHHSGGSDCLESSSLFWTGTGTRVPSFPMLDYVSFGDARDPVILLLAHCGPTGCQSMLLPTVATPAVGSLQFTRNGVWTMIAHLQSGGSLAFVVVLLLHNCRSPRKHLASPTLHCLPSCSLSGMAWRPCDLS